MKLISEDRNVARSGNFPEKTFQIAANAKAFDILSSKLYTDKHLAIVRELSTNAWDAHVEAGTQDKPFDVHLPNEFAPFFAIRDYGTGLSPESVEEIYSTYFASTRNESNDFVGALGLGSKSPFSYTDQFTITSYWNGKAYTYSAFKNESGSPSIALLGEDDSSEPNGVEIRINTKTNDSVQFHIAARRVYRFFPVMPNITGAKIEFPTVEPRFKGTTYHVYDCGMHNVQLPGTINIVMGNICYPVDANRFTSRLGHNGVIVIFANIGDVEVAASREELHYSDSTIANLQKRINDAINEVNEEIEKALGVHICLLEKIKALRHYKSVIDFSYNANTIATEVPNEYSLKRIELRNDKLYIGRDRWQATLEPHAETRYVLIENDIGDELKQSEKSRLRYFLSSQHGQFYMASIQDRQKFNETFGDVNAVLSKLPDAPKNARVGYNGPRTFIKRAINHYSNRNNSSWKSVVGDIDVNDAIAVPRKDIVAWIHGKAMTGETVHDWATELGYTNVYGIAQTYYDRIRKELNLNDLEEEAREHIQQIVDNLTEYELCYYKYGYVSYDYSGKFINWINGLSDECTDVAKLSKVKPLSSVLVSMINTFQITMPEARDFQKLFNMKYPLISSVNINIVQKNDVIEYIQLKNQQHV